ncbi:phosphatidylinositol transfer protein alpha isoform-like isoform X2 [Mercenaria mercenaria]|uniref:phosphatidylinositol transfer protein alpha isoform-like isoform X2 n=1 Tax=Mercenaria mercenaria TaxID=6596 RepID=UPI001E1D3616|nr:phosphatidylinositol transfer protein alpha isoform-like isoform X2 [Mercenaria mercenaria]
MGVIVHEYRVVLPMTVEEYQVAQLYSVAEASKENTGGGEGIEVLVNEPFELKSEDECQQQIGDDKNDRVPEKPLFANGQKFLKGQYTHKIYHLQSKVPGFIRAIAPKGSLEIHEKAWNAYPYCRTIVTNPGYMKDAFFIKIETMHYADRGNTENIHGLTGDDLQKRNVTTIDIANDPVSSKDYKKEFDPKIFKSEKTGRGPLDNKDWIKSVDPVMCAYKLVTIKFKWFGLQGRVESFINRQEHRLFTTFHRQVFCWTDKWHGMTMADIRAIEEKTKAELDEQRKHGELRGMKAED